MSTSTQDMNLGYEVKTDREANQISDRHVIADPRIIGGMNAQLQHLQQKPEVERENENENIKLVEAKVKKEEKALKDLPERFRDRLIELEILPGEYDENQKINDYKHPQDGQRLLTRMLVKYIKTQSLYIAKKITLRDFDILLEYGADPNLPCFDLDVYCEVAHKNKDTVQLGAYSESSIIYDDPRYQGTLLSMIVKNALEHECRLLDAFTKSGADINKLDGTNNSPLTHVIKAHGSYLGSKDNNQRVRKLLGLGAHVRIIDLEMAINKKVSMDIFEALLKNVHPDLDKQWSEYYLSARSKLQSAIFSVEDVNMQVAYMNSLLAKGMISAEAFGQLALNELTHSKPSLTLISLNPQGKGSTPNQAANCIFKEIYLKSKVFYEAIPLPEAMRVIVRDYAYPNCYIDNNDTPVYLYRNAFTDIFVELKIFSTDEWAGALPDGNLVYQYGKYLYDKEQRREARKAQASKIVELDGQVKTLTAQNTDLVRRQRDMESRQSDLENKFAELMRAFQALGQGSMATTSTSTSQPVQAPSSPVIAIAFQQNTASASVSLRQAAGKAAPTLI